ncbi:unnamed protein product [Gadus morhua 'NCC']
MKSWQGFWESVARRSGSGKEEVEVWDQLGEIREEDQPHRERSLSSDEPSACSTKTGVEEEEGSAPQSPLPAPPRQGWRRRRAQPHRALRLLRQDRGGGGGGLSPTEPSSAPSRQGWRRRRAQPHRDLCLLRQDRGGGGGGLSPTETSACSTKTWGGGEGDDGENKDVYTTVQTFCRG